MKTSIRSKKFTMGMVLFLAIILLLSVSSAYYLNMLSNKTNAILTENHLSVIYARDMSENLMNINQEVTNCFLINRNPDSSLISKELNLFKSSLLLEKNNITEVGEDKLVKGIETGYTEYANIVIEIIKSPITFDKVLNLQKKYGYLYQQEALLSQMNENAIEQKTNDAKISAKNYTLQMTLIASLCFLIAYGYTFIFSSYFNERFYQLYNGIKKTVSSNYSQRFELGGNDELSEISLIFNEMAEKLSKFDLKSSVSIVEPLKRESYLFELQELKMVLTRMKSIEKEAIELITKFDDKK